MTRVIGRGLIILRLSHSVPQKTRTGQTAGSLRSAEGCGERLGVDQGEGADRAGEGDVEEAEAVVTDGGDCRWFHDDHRIELQALRGVRWDDRDGIAQAGD